VVGAGETNPISTLGAAIVAAVLVGCLPVGSAQRSPAGATPAAFASGREKGTPAPADFITPPRVVLDVAQKSPGLVDVLPDGTRRMLVRGVRLLDHPDGSIERARQLLPSGGFRVVDLPARLGGGLIVAVNVGGATRIWRAESWMGDLVPLTELGNATLDIVAGFGLLYAIFPNGDLAAVDPSSGQQVSPGPIPSGLRIRSLAFADAWRAVAIVDFRGALATFDAGSSWHPVPLEGLTPLRVTVEQGNPVIETHGGSFILGPSGDAIRTAAAATPSHEVFGVVAGKRDRRPLRAAIEDGWPLDQHSAVIADAGSLHVVRLADGSIIVSRESAVLLSGAHCHAIAVRQGFGFVCGSAMGPTAVYGFEPPLSVRELVRFSGPRVVVASGNGGLVVHGSCARDRAASAAGTASEFCFFAPSGEEREVVFAARDQTAHPARPVALADGRLLVLVPPGARGGGKLVIAGGGGDSVVPLSADSVDAQLGRATWLEGVQQLDQSTLGAWVVLGGTVRGVRVTLDGRVEIGPAGCEIERTVVAGRFGLSWDGGQRGYETVDGGMHWEPVTLPEQDLPRPARDVAACSAVGCAMGAVLRVGWGGSRSGDDAPPPRPRRTKISFVNARPISLVCEATGQTSGPPGRVPAAAPRASKRPPPAAPAAVGSSALSKWEPLRGAPAPQLARGNGGLDVGTDPSAFVQARLYLWGPNGSDFSRTGCWQVKFDDRFDLFGIRATAATGAIWSDAEHAVDSLGLGNAAFVRFYALLDPSGHAAVLAGRRGSGRADLYGVVAGEPAARWRDAEGGVLPDPVSAVRADTSWFFAAVQSAGPTANYLSLFRVDAGVARRFARLARPSGSPSDPVVRLVRRVHAGSLGILVQGPPEFGRSVRDWYVLPVDRDTGEVDQPVRLIGSDLEGRQVARCQPDADGWIVDTFPAISPGLRVLGPASASLTSIELRLRLDPGSVCIDAISARIDGTVQPVRQNSRSIDPSTAIPMVVTDPATGRRSALRCASEP
jgi:hypothetical protein